MTTAAQQAISWAYRKTPAAALFPLAGLIDQAAMATTVIPTQNELQISGGGVPLRLAMATTVIAPMEIESSAARRAVS